MEANNEEVCLAKEFGAATLLGVAKRATKNPTSRDNLSDLSQLKKSRDFLEAKVMFGNSFCFLFSKTCFWEYKEKTIFLYF